MQPDARGYFGTFGGRFVPEVLIAALDELTREVEAAFADDAFWSEYHDAGPPALASLQAQPILGLVHSVARAVLIGIGVLFLIVLVSGIVVLGFVARRARARRKSAWAEI